MRILTDFEVDVILAGLEEIRDPQMTTAADKLIQALSIKDTTTIRVELHEERPDDDEEGGSVTPVHLQDLIKRFLLYSFEDIHFQWNNLTAAEKTFATEEEFKALMEWVRSQR